MESEPEPELEVRTHREESFMLLDLADASADTLDVSQQSYLTLRALTFAVLDLADAVREPKSTEIEIGLDHDDD